MQSIRERSQPRSHKLLNAPNPKKLLASAPFALQVLRGTSDTLVVPEAKSHPEAHFTGRQRRRLSLARENGYLNAACRYHEKLLAAHARWCWSLRIPVVWSERRSPRSRYGLVHLDLFTTPHRLTADCQADMRSLAPRATTSPHDARWERIPLGDLDRIAAAVFRASTRPGNYQPNGAHAPALPARLPAAKVLSFDPPRAALG
jgi:hypothetical protein